MQELQTSIVRRPGLAHVYRGNNGATYCVDYVTKVAARTKILQADQIVAPERRLISLNEPDVCDGRFRMYFATKARHHSHQYVLCSWQEVRAHSQWCRRSCDLCFR